MSFDGPFRSIKTHEVEGSSNDMSFLGQTKDIRVEKKWVQQKSWGFWVQQKTWGSRRGNKKWVHWSTWGFGLPNEMRFKILSQICLSPSMHMKIYSWGFLVRPLHKGMEGFPKLFGSLRTFLGDWSYISGGLHFTSSNPPDMYLAIYQQFICPQLL
jgi:hypothetical protein